MRSAIRSTRLVRQPQDVARAPRVHQRLRDLRVDRLVHRGVARAEALDPARRVELGVRLGRGVELAPGRRVAQALRQDARALVVARGSGVARERGDRVGREQQRVVVDAPDRAVARAVVALLRHPQRVEVGREPVGEAPVVGVRERRAGKPRRGERSVLGAAAAGAGRGQDTAARPREHAARQACAERSTKFRRVRRSVRQRRAGGRVPMGLEHAIPVDGALRPGRRAPARPAGAAAHKGARSVGHARCAAGANHVGRRP